VGCRGRKEAKEVDGEPPGKQNEDFKKNHPRGKIPPREGWGTNISLWQKGEREGKERKDRNHANLLF